MEGWSAEFKKGFFVGAGVLVALFAAGKLFSLI